VRGMCSACGAREVSRHTPGAGGEGVEAPLAQQVHRQARHAVNAFALDGPSRFPGAQVTQHVQSGAPHCHLWEGEAHRRHTEVKPQ